MTTKTIPDGTVLAWFVLDFETLEQILRCETRDEARQYKDIGILSKLVKVH